jgi:hypothetical protein
MHADAANDARDGIAAEDEAELDDVVDEEAENERWFPPAPHPAPRTASAKITAHGAARKAGAAVRPGDTRVPIDKRNEPNLPRVSQGRTAAPPPLTLT